MRPFEEAEAGWERESGRRSGLKRPRDRWYRVRVDVQRASAGGLRAHVIAWRSRRGATERYWASLELAVGKGHPPELVELKQAQGQQEAVLEAVRCAKEEAEAPLAQLLERLVAGAVTYGVVAW